MQGKLELYQQEISTASKPIYTRLEQYRKVMYEIRTLLKNYFFDLERTKKLTEAAQEDQRVYSFNLVQEEMKKCLVDEGALLKTAQTILSDSEEHPSLVDALDVHVLQSGLPIQLQEKSLYIFSPETPYTPMGQAFMQQFAYALSTYRICLGICDIYFKVYCHDGVQTAQFEKCIESANDLKKQLEEEENLNALHTQAKIIEKEILDLFRTEKTSEGIDDFKEGIDNLGIQLVKLLETGAIHLQNAYKEFPNNPILWMFHDRSWHTLLKTLSGLLYGNHYTYSTLSGTLEIKKEFIDFIKKEIDSFASMKVEKIPLLRVEFLKKSATHLNDTKIEILSKMAVNKIELIEAPKVGMFSTPASPDIYRLMYTAHLRQWSTPPVEDLNKEEKESYIL